MNDKLTCASPMEAPYYVTFSDPLCYYCGSEHDLTSTFETYPIRVECKARKHCQEQSQACFYQKKRFENCCLYLIFEDSYFMNCLYHIYSCSHCKVHCSIRNYWENI